jgi:hypothetical protein
MFDGKNYKPETETPVLSEVGQVLWDAADEIERRGWCQNDLVTAEGRICLQGAMYAVIGGAFHGVGSSLRVVCSLTQQKLFYNANTALMNYLGIASPWMWNDRKGRTKEEVVTALRSAARVA